MAFLNPSKIVDEFDIISGMKAADFGCGAGHFSIEIARRAGKEGIVYAFDVQEEVLEALKSRAILEHLPNIETSRVDLETEKGTRLTDGLLDVVLISNMLFQAERKDIVAKEAARVLKSGGRAIVIEWKMSANNPELGQAQYGASLGPLKEMRVAKETLQDIFIKAGFVVNKEFEAGDSHYGVVFTRLEI